MKSHSLRTRRLALFGISAALCLAVQLMPRPPNVEFTSFFTFTVGVMCGVLDGAFFGCFVMFVNGFLSPYGFAGLNMPFQMFGMAIAGVLGGVYRSLIPKQIGPARFCVETAIVGALIALVFDLVTNVGVGFQLVLSGVSFPFAMLTAMAYGVFFSVIHIFSNTVVFGVLTVPSMKTLNSLVRGKKIG